MSGKREKLSFEEARILILCHAFRYHDLAHPKMERGFLGSLRPFQGLDAANFHEVMDCLDAFGDYFEQSQSIDKEILASLFCICHFARAWGVYKEGMLRSNGLIAESDVVVLEDWIEHISYTTACLLDGCGAQVAFEFYDQAYDDG